MQGELATKGSSQGSSESGVVAQFFQAAAYAGIEAPLRAVAQIADQFKDFHADSTVQAVFKDVGIEEPKPSEFATKDWYAQQLGSAIGMIVPFLALRSGIGKLSGLGASTESSLGEATASLTQLAAREAALSGTSGLLYGAFLSPSNSADVGKSSFYKDRLGNGLTDMATFGALGFTSPYLSAGLDAAAGQVERSSLPDLVKTPSAWALRLPVVSGVFAGIPGGAVNAEANAWKNGELVASPEEFKESIASMAFIGGAMGTALGLMEGDRQTSSSTSTRGTSAVDGKGQGGGGSDIDSTGPKPANEMPNEEALREKVEQALRQLRLNPPNRAQETLPPANLMETIAGMASKARGVLLTPADRALAGASRASGTIKSTDSGIPGLEVVLGASGAETTAHAGFLKALEEDHVPIGRITGVSGGSLVAALYANKYSADQIKSILLSDQFRNPSYSVLAQCFHLADPWNLFPYSFDFRPFVQNFVDTYHLKPQPNLRLIAADSETHQPVIFEGTNIDLTTAITASAAATPGMNMKPVSYEGRELIDGFYYHPTPAALCEPPAIASKIGFVSKLPSELLSPWDYFMHLREMSYYDDFKRRYPDPPGHIIVRTGLPDVATTTFGISTDTLEKLVQHGQTATAKRLAEPDAVKAITDAQNQIKS